MRVVKLTLLDRLVSRATMGRSMEKAIHPVQINILRELLFKPNSRFSDLNVKGLTSDHFTFHLKKLADQGLVVKMDDHYRLTPQGKEFANRMDTDSLIMERQAKVAVLMVGVRRGLRGAEEFLLQKRLKEPFFGRWGGFTGKIHWGEKVEEAAAREFREETGLSGKFSLIAIKHKIDRSLDGRILEDKFFYTFRVDVPAKAPEVVRFPEGGENAWCKKGEIEKLDKFEDLAETLRLIEGKRLIFTEKDYTHSLERY